jgi:hypothetical protein
VYNHAAADTADDLFMSNGLEVLIEQQQNMNGNWPIGGFRRDSFSITTPIPQTLELAASASLARPR